MRRARFPGRGHRPAALRPGFTAGRRAARRYGRSRRAHEAPLSRGISRTRPRHIRRFVCDSRRAAQRQNRWHLHPAVRSRCQAAISRAHPACLADPATGPEASGTDAGGGLVRAPYSRGRTQNSAMPSSRLNVPDSAIVLAAGRGKRMGALTDQTPKPLIRVEGRALIDHVLDRLAVAGIKRAVVNLHYMGDAIAAHLARRRDIEIEFSRETEALETGGGVVNALPLLGEIFYVLNADVFWLDGATMALHQLAAG